ncbi:unnamed protein product [Cercospora beticola]|nr:unnamed protein product [Cercospora beticola]
MAVVRRAKDDPRLQALLETAQQSLQHLRDRTQVPPKVANDIEVHIRTSFNALTPATVVKRGRDLDAYGTDLWNAAAAAIFEGEGDQRVEAPNSTALGISVRVFALLLLDASHCASVRRSKDAGQQARLFRVANQTARLCLEKHRLDLSVTALEVGSKYIPQPVDEPSLMHFDTVQEEQIDEHGKSMRQLEGEYYLLRILHSWKSERYDLADHFYQSWFKVRGFVVPHAPGSVARAADLFYELARHLSKTDSGISPLNWYDRALTTLHGAAEQTDSEHCDLLVSTAVAYVEELLKSDQDSCISRAHEVVTQLESRNSLSNRISLPLLKLSIMAKMQNVDSAEVEWTLLHAIRLCHLTQHNFTLVMQAASKAYHTFPDIAISAMQIFAMDRILPEMASAGDRADQVKDWLEKATITCTLWASRQMIETGKYLSDKLLLLYDQIQQRQSEPFTTKATHAAQTLIWKAVDGSVNAASGGCCQLLRHPLFCNAGHVNKGRIGRRLMRGALDANELDAAHQYFLEMPISVQNEAATRCMAFQLAIRSNDLSLAEESLRIIANRSEADATYLYACVLDAQNQPQMRPLAVLALRTVLECKPPGLQVGSLLRCMARLLMVEANAGGSDQETVIREVVAVFKLAASSIDDIRKCPQKQWLVEAQWWSKNAYNLVVRNCSSTSPELLLELLSACMLFLDNYPQGPEYADPREIAQRRSVCMFLSTISLVALGRSSTDDAILAEQCFTKAQQTIAAFRTLSQQGQNDDEENTSRTFTMARFDLECTLRLRRWDMLDTVLRSCLEIRSSDRWDALADLVIVIHEYLDTGEKEAHTELITQLLQKAINETWKKDKDILKVSRWLRYAFMLCIDHENGDFARKLLQQASRMAESGQRGKYDLYPESELQWLATTGFNHAIDLISRGKLQHAKAWLEDAVEVARWTQDNGVLHAMLSSKRQVAEERIDEMWSDAVADGE